MSIEKQLKDLEHLNVLKVTLESFDTLPKDSLDLLNAFKLTSPSLEGVKFEDKRVALESIGTKIKDLIAAAIKWVGTQIQEFIAFVRSGKLEVGNVEKELAAIKAKFSSAQSFNDGKITLSPMVTTRLAIEGTLDNTFPAKLLRVRDTVNLIFEMQPAAIKLGSEIADKASAAVVDETKTVYLDFTKDLAKFSELYARKLTMVDKTRSLIGTRRFTQADTLAKGGMKIQDMASAPLPGGYSLVGTLFNIPPSFSFSSEMEHEGRLENIINGLLKSIQPELVRTHSADITFSGAALNRHDCKAVIDESENILGLIKGSFNDESQIKGALDKVYKALREVRESEGAGTLTSRIECLHHLVKFIEMDKSQLVRYALGVIRASVRYVNASITPAEEVKPVAEGNRLPSPAV